MNGAPPCPCLGTIRSRSPLISNPRKFKQAPVQKYLVVDTGSNRLVLKGRTLLFNKCNFVNFSKRGGAFLDLFQCRLAQRDHPLMPRNLTQLRNGPFF